MLFQDLILEATKDSGGVWWIHSRWQEEKQAVRIKVNHLLGVLFDYLKTVIEAKIDPEQSIAQKTSF